MFSLFARKGSNASNGLTIQTHTESPRVVDAVQAAPDSSCLITSSPTRIPSKKLKGTDSPTGSPSKTIFSPLAFRAWRLSGSGKQISPPRKGSDSDGARPRWEVLAAEHSRFPQVFDEYDETVYDPWLSVAQMSMVTMRNPRQSLLPTKTCVKPTLVLDLDETLVHCSTEPSTVREPHMRFDVEFNNRCYCIAARRRPGLEDFLEFIKDKFEVVVFTASQRVYADKLLNLLDPKKEFFKHRLFRDDCLNVNGSYLKDLAVLGRDLSKTAIVDNSPQAFSLHVDNGLPILSWFDDDKDKELYKLIPVLSALLRADDFRPILRDHYKLYEKVQQRKGA